VDRTWTIPLYAATVQFRRITLVPVKVVPGIQAVICFHDGISFDLGKDRSCCNRNAEGIAFYERALRYGDVGEGEGIDENYFRYRRELFYGVGHRTLRGGEDVDLINDVGSYDPKGMTESGLFDNAGQQCPLFCRELFGIIYIGVVIMSGKNDRGSYDRSSKWTSASFINTSNKIMLFPQISVRQGLHPFYPRVVP